MEVKHEQKKQVENVYGELIQTDEWLRPKDVSALLKVSKPLPYQWVKRGLIPHYKLADKVIRFKKEDLEAFIGKCRIEGKK